MELGRFLPSRRRRVIRHHGEIFRRADETHECVQTPRRLLVLEVLHEGVDSGGDGGEGVLVSALGDGGEALAVVREDLVERGGHLGVAQGAQVEVSFGGERAAHRARRVRVRHIQEIGKLSAVPRTDCGTGGVEELSERGGHFVARTKRGFREKEERLPGRDARGVSEKSTRAPTRR